jgi:hypothetical protein
MAFPSFAGDRSLTNSPNELHADLKPFDNDPALCNKIMKKRQEELTRRNRLFDTRRFRKGVSHDVLAEQIAEKRAIQEALKAEDAYHDHFRVVSDQVAQVCETIRHEATRERQKAVTAYSLDNLRKEQRREYALSDPNMLKSERPTRDGDNDPRLGPSSVQTFEGEDFLAQKKKKENQLNMREWLAHQCAEKMAAQDRERESDRLYDEAMRVANEVRGVCEVSNAEEMVNEKKAEAEENKRLAEVHRNRKQMALDKERKARLDHVENERNSERLRELHDYKLGVDGRLMKGEYKRLSLDEEANVYDTNAQLVLEKMANQRAQKAASMAESKLGGQADMVLNAIEMEKDRATAARRQEAEDANKALAAKKKAYDKLETKAYRSFTHVETFPLA